MQIAIDPVLHPRPAPAAVGQSRCVFACINAIVTIALQPQTTRAAPNGGLEAFGVDSLGVHTPSPSTAPPVWRAVANNTVGQQQGMHIS